MAAKFNIDYIQYSIDENPMVFEDTAEHTKSNMTFYKNMSTYTGGIRVYTGNPNTDKQLVVMSGKSCEYHEHRIMEIIETVIENGGTFSRIDFACTTDDGETLAKFVSAIAEGKLISKRFKIEDSKMITDVKTNVETCYVGDMKKRGKRGIFRAYNKGIEQGLGIDLIRFELECKRQVANTNARRLRDGMSIGNIIRNSVDLADSKWYSDLMGEKTPPLRLNDEKPEFETESQKRWMWLYNQVAPALGKALFDDFINDENNRERFWEIVEKSYMIEKGMRSNTKK